MDYDFYNPYLLNKPDTIDAEELMATPYAPKNFIVADMLPEGLPLLCGPSKIGKSWFVLQLCLCVALGRMFLGHNIISSDVLYLALEDTFARVKDRVARLTEECPTNLRFAVQAGSLGGELEEQLLNHKTQYPDTKLVVIDTLQKVRGASDPKAGSPTYGKDYRAQERARRISRWRFRIRDRP
ncbi:MAG: AAA family ATPase [Ruminococcaceae bacterium]|nr:AAA family ATPase [Oscillospiraceae bacterium]